MLGLDDVSEAGRKVNYILLVRAISTTCRGGCKNVRAELQAFSFNVLLYLPSRTDLEDRACLAGGLNI